MRARRRRPRRVYLAEGEAPRTEVPPPPSLKKYWTRCGIAEWLVERLAEDAPLLVGIDHGFSFPLRYFEEHGLLLDWPSFLDDFHRHWPTDEDHTSVDSVRNGLRGNGAEDTSASMASCQAGPAALSVTPNISAS